MQPMNGRAPLQPSGKQILFVLFSKMAKGRLNTNTVFRRPWLFDGYQSVTASDFETGSPIFCT